MKPQTVHHTLEPLFDENSRVLILGTMPSPKSREAGFYYYHPQNRFWRVLSAVLEEIAGSTASIQASAAGTQGDARSIAEDCSASPPHRW